MTQHQIPDDSNPALSGHALTRAGMAFLLVAFAAAVGASIYRSSTGVSESRAQASATRPESTLLIREGARITVPERSPLRSKLTVAAVAEKEIQRTLALPAVVEADPARTVKVLPPVAGRVTDLMVQLGGRVTQGQELS